MELFRLLGTIAIDNTEANNAIDETTDRAREGESETSNAFNKIGSTAGTIAKGIGTASVAIGGAFLATIESTREYRTEMGKLDAAFVAHGHSSKTAKRTYSELNAVLGDSGQAVEASNHLALLTNNEKELETWTNICTGVYATFGDSLPIEGLTESANETAKVGQVTGSLADALNWAGISEDDFNEKLATCSTEQERQKLIMDTLNGTYEKASEQYKQNNKDVLEANKANEKLSDAFAKIGAVGEPILTTIKTKIAEMVELAVPKLQELIQKIQDVIQWVQNNQDTIQIWVGVILGATTTIGTFLLILNWGKIMTAAASAINVVRTAILAMNVAMLANPIGLIVALIAGLVVAFIYLWNNVEPFRQFWIDLWNKIKDVTTNVVQSVKTKFSEMYNSMKEKFESMKSKATSIFNNIKSTISNTVQGAKDKAVSAFNSIKSGIIDPIVSAKNKVSETFGNIRNTIADKIESARRKVKEVIDKIKGYFNISLKFKGLKMPSIKLTLQKGSGLMAKAAKLLGLDGVPKFSVSWNAEGGILKKPTIFGFDGETFLGGGEAGKEAVAPIDLLQDYISQAVDERNTEIIEALVMQFTRLISFLQNYIPSNTQIMLDTGVLVGELVPSVDYRLGEKYKHTKRGNIR